MLPVAVILLLGFGVLTVWAGFARVSVFDVIRSTLGAPVPQRDEYGALKSQAKGA